MAAIRLWEVLWTPRHRDDEPGSEVGSFLKMTYDKELSSREESDRLCFAELRKMTPCSLLSLRSFQGRGTYGDNVQTAHDEEQPAGHLREKVAVVGKDLSSNADP